jgi:uncharacterized protein (DUF2141 family)
LLVYACANRGQGPTGGPKDVTPPKIMRSTPHNGAVNFKKNLIEIEFDENISIEKASENVIISPPQVKPPDVKALGNKAIVNFNQDLLDSTTYSVNFGNAIVDLNEKNVLKNFLFSFSTGNQIDTLRISGTVLNAEDLNPISGIIVGIYADTDDKVFAKKPFLRIGKTDEKGHFSIDNVKKGTYKVFALGDDNHDYFYEPSEGLAMMDSLVTPAFRMEEKKDTVWKDSTHVDSVRTHMGPHFLPDNLVLQFFRETIKRQYLVKNERKEPYSFNLLFNAPEAELPTIKPLNFNWDGKYLLQKNNTKDSLTYWLTDSTVWKIDTLKMTVAYMKTDSLMKLVPTTDTLNLFQRKTISKIKTKKSGISTKVEHYKFTNNIASSFDVYNPVFIHFETPLATAELSKIKLYQKVDTVLKPIKFKWVQSDSTQMNYAIEYKWVPEKSYELKIDSTAFTSIYNRVSDKFTESFKIKSLEEYSKIKLLLATFNPKIVLQVLDTKDTPIMTKKAEEKGTIFENLKPGDYYIRMFIDENGNGKWDTGELASHKQPEQVYYYPKKLTLMANWEFEETWDYKQTPLLLQKPTAIKKDAKKKEGN